MIAYLTDSEADTRENHLADGTKAKAVSCVSRKQMLNYDCTLNCLCALPAPRRYVPFLELSATVLAQYLSNFTITELNCM